MTSISVDMNRVKTSVPDVMTLMEKTHKSDCAHKGGHSHHAQVSIFVQLKTMAQYTGTGNDSIRKFDSGIPYLRFFSFLNSVALLK